MMDNKMKLEYIDDYLKMENGFRPNLPNEVMDAAREKFLEKWHDNIPSTLYYYMPFAQKYHVKSLIDSKLWFSYPQYFNDPNDSRVILDFNEDISDVNIDVCLEYFRKMLESIREKIKLNKGQWGDLSQDLISGRQDSDLQFRVYFLERLLSKQCAAERVLAEILAKLEKKDAINISSYYNQYKRLLVEALLDAYDKEIAICSFSIVRDNMLMWTHYADQHKGICIEYSVCDLMNALGIVFPVIYGHTARYGDLLDYNRKVIPLFSDRDNILKKFLFKNEEWKYEKEWRALLDTRKNCHDFHADLRGFLSPKFKPARIYVGNNMSKDDRSFIKARCDEMGIECYRMRIKEDSCEFDDPMRY